MTQKLRLKTKSTNPTYFGGGDELLTPSTDLSLEGSTPLPLRNEQAMEKVIWVNQDGSQELWMCYDGTLKGILKNSILLMNIWGRTLAMSNENQAYWSHRPLPGQNKEERNEDRN